MELCNKNDRNGNKKYPFCHEKQQQATVFRLLTSSSPHNSLTRSLTHSLLGLSEIEIERIELPLPKFVAYITFIHVDVNHDEDQDETGAGAGAGAELRAPAGATRGKCWSSQEI